MLFRLLILVIQSKKTYYDTKFCEIKKKLDHDYAKYINSRKCYCNIKTANLATKAYIADFVKETDFNNKLNNLNKNVTSNKTKHSLVKNEK